MGAGLAVRNSHPSDNRDGCSDGHVTQGFPLRTSREQDETWASESSSYHFIMAEAT